MSVTVKWDGLDQFKKDLRNLPEDLAEEAADPVEDAAEFTASSLRQSYPIGDTGNLRGGVVVTTERNRFGVASMVKSKSPHAHLWEFGTENRKTRQGWARGISGEHEQQGLVPIAARNRRRMYDALMGVLQKAGFQVSGRA